MNVKLSFHPESALGHTLFRWWKSLENDRGTRAELRKAHDLTAVALAKAGDKSIERRIALNRFILSIVNNGEVIPRRLSKKICQQ